MSSTDDEFWNYSVTTYGKPSVAEACLWMQDECGIDINMLLLCCWYARTRGEFTETYFRQAREFSSKWGAAVVCRLRAIRRWMKATGCREPHMLFDECMQLRERIKAAELDAERRQQHVLASLSRSITCKSRPVRMQLAAAAANLRCYLDSEHVTIDDRAASRLATILVAAVDGADRMSVEAAIRRNGC